MRSGIILRKGEHIWLWVLLAPTLLGLLVGSLGPVLAAVGISFTN
jgi:ABC-type sugar transport system permease subunit